MTAPRVHEVAKAFGLSSKVLMNDLASHGFEYKTHMAALEDGALKYLRKKYPDFDTKLAGYLSTSTEELKKKADAKPKAPSRPKTKSQKLVTQRTVARDAKSDETLAAPSTKRVELVERETGKAGETVTLEQKVVKAGVLRRRRVEPSAIKPEEQPLAEVETAPEPQEYLEQEYQQEAVPEIEVLEEAPVQIEEEVQVQEQEFAPAASGGSAQSAEAAPRVEQQAQPQPQPQPQQPQPQRGRDLSAPSRLRIVETPATPYPLPKPPGPRPGARPTTATAAGAKTAATAGVPKKPGAPGEEPWPDEDSIAKGKAAAAKKRVGAHVTKEEEALRLTKRDLLGMMEEVEITRPSSRKAKKPAAKIERRSTQVTTPGAMKRKIKIDQDISVADLANAMGVKAPQIIQKLVSLGQMATIHHRIDLDTATLIAGEFGYEVQNVSESAEDLLKQSLGEVAGIETRTRAPIVTVMGHVDHGKTSVLDYLRKTKVVSGEAGGITQHIGAYQIEKNGKIITFIDTPGHAAFTSMRARGAAITDIVILVVAADEGVKPQTLEALAHAKAAKVPVIVAINKMDKPEAKPDVVMQELSGHELVPEAWGGDTIFVKISAKAGTGMDELLEMILIQSEVLDLKSRFEGAARGIIIESRLDRGKGPVATMMIREGVLHVGDNVVSGSTFGKVRAIFNDSGKPIESAGPSTPVEVLGFDATPEVGETAFATDESEVARRASEISALAKRKSEHAKYSRASLEDLVKKMQAGESAELRVVLKGDVQGSLEAIADALNKIDHAKVKTVVIYKAVGGVSESDVDLAAASGAMIVGFNVRPTAQAKQLAARENVEIKFYNVIYDLVDEVKAAMAGLLAPVFKESTLGQAEVREVFNVSKVGPIAGCFVKSGKIQRNAMARLIRDSVVVYTAKISSLRRFKDDAREVPEGFECGIRIENFSDLKPGDVIECFEQVQVSQAVG